MARRAASGPGVGRYQDAARATIRKDKRVQIRCVGGARRSALSNAILAVRSHLAG